MKNSVLQLVVPIALKETIEALEPDIERDLSVSIAATHMLNPEVPGYTASGAAWDLAFTNPWHVAPLLSDPSIDAASHRAFGRSPLAFALRGEEQPVQQTDSSTALISQVQREARRIGVTKAGTSGDQFQRLMADLGLGEEVAQKLVQLPGGGPMRSLLQGEVDVAALPLSNIAPISGVYAKAICPLSLGVHIDISLFTSSTASPAAKRLADWLVDPARDEALHRLGLRRFEL